jgi:hypothetical protein
MQASALAERYKPLVEAKAVSQQEFANAQAAQKQAEADVAAGKAAVQTARINLAYASVTAPISGRIGRALVTEGALVGQGEATPLAVIQQIDPLYVNFTQSAGEVMKLRRALESGQLKRAGGQAASVRVVLDDGSEYPLPGKLLFSDLTVDATTGQITLRAEVPNPKGERFAARPVRARAAGAGPGQQRHHAAPAGRHPHASRATRSWWWAPTARSSQRRSRWAPQQQPVGRAGRPEGRRAGHGGRLPEAADDAARHGQARAVAGPRQRRRRCPRLLPRRPAPSRARLRTRIRRLRRRNKERAPWPSSLSTAPSLRG